MAGEHEGTPIPGEIEAKAGRMGWVPKEDFRGDEARWIEADKFVERGETEVPIMRERMRKMDKTVVGLNSTIKTMKKTFGDFQKYHTKVAENAYNKAMKDLTEKQRRAVKDGDTEAFDKIEKTKTDLKLEVPEVDEVTPEDEKKIEAQRILDEWVADGNEWFTKDRSLQRLAAATSEIIQDGQGLVGRELYDAVKEDLEVRYPEKFGNKNRKKANTVIGDGEEIVAVGKRTWANLPKEAKEAAREFIKEIPGFTKEQYVKDYQWE